MIELEINIDIGHNRIVMSTGEYSVALPLELKGLDLHEVLEMLHHDEVLTELVRDLAQEIL
jgi:hypothetical protein